MPCPSLLTAALDSASRGIPVFPCKADKTPLTRHGFRDATTDDILLRRMFSHPDAGLIGMPTGTLTDTAVLDVDSGKSAAAADWIATYRHELPTTYTVQTRSGGLHLYYLHHPGLRSSVAKVAPGIDVRGIGGYVIIPPSPGYTVVNDTPAVPWPQWLTPAPPAAVPATAASYRPPERVSAALTGLVRCVALAPEGSRNGKLHWAAHRIREMAERGEVDRHGALALLRAAAAHAGTPDREAGLTIASAMRGAA